MNNYFILFYKNNFDVSLEKNNEVDMHKYI